MGLLEIGDEIERALGAASEDEGRFRGQAGRGEARQKLQALGIERYSLAGWRSTPLLAEAVDVRPGRHPRRRTSPRRVGAATGWGPGHFARHGSVWEAPAASGGQSQDAPRGWNSRGPKAFYHFKGRHPFAKAEWIP